MLLANSFPHSVRHAPLFLILGTLLLHLTIPTTALIIPLNWKHDHLLARAIPDTSTSLSTLKSTLLSIRTHYSLPALAIGAGNATSFSAAAVGVRKEGVPIPALPTDTYHLGSLTKAMTATLLALLVQDPTLNIEWTSPLPSLLPGFTLHPSHAHTTLQDLTAHRSGIADVVLTVSEVDALWGLTARQGRWRLANATLASPAAHSRGTYTYANANYVLAGLMLDLYAGSRRAEEVFAHRLWGPLGVESAGWGPCPERNDTSVDNPWPHWRGKKGEPLPVEGVPWGRMDNPPAYNTAGRVHVRPRGYNAFLQLHLAATQSPPPSHNAIGLSQAQFDHLHTAYPTTDITDPGYGYTYGGWLRRNFTADDGTDAYVLAHDGSNTLNYAFALLDTHVGEAYMALTNVGGDKAEVAVVEAIVGMRNGTLVF